MLKHASASVVLGKPLMFTGSKVQKGKDQLRGSHLQIFGVLVDQHLHVEALLSLSGTGYDLLLRRRRHFRPQLQQSFAESLRKHHRDPSDTVSEDGDGNDSYTQGQRLLETKNVKDGTSVALRTCSRR